MKQVYEQTSQENMESYIDNIKTRLANEAPEWHVVLQSIGSDCYYHIARFDFSKGPNYFPEIPINYWIFAYQRIGPDKTEYLLSNIHPLENHV